VRGILIANWSPALGQFKTQAIIFDRDTVMKYTHPAIAISDTQTNAIAKPCSLILVTGNAAKTLWNICYSL
jgi:hypothetical protein